MLRHTHIWKYLEFFLSIDIFYLVSLFPQFRFYNLSFSNRPITLFYLQLSCFTTKTNNIYDCFIVHCVYAPLLFEFKTIKLFRKKKLQYHLQVQQRKHRFFNCFTFPLKTRPIIQKKKDSCYFHYICYLYLKGK